MASNSVKEKIINMVQRKQRKKDDKKDDQNDDDLMQGKKRKTDNYEHNLRWLTFMQSWIKSICPSLQTFIIEGISMASLYVYPCPQKVQQIGGEEARIVVDAHQTVELQVLNKRVLHKEEDREELRSLLKMFEANSPYVICRGLDKKYTDILPLFPSESSEVRRWEDSERVDSEVCELWMKQPARYLPHVKAENRGSCKSCRHLGQSLKKRKYQNKETAPTAEATKSRTNPRPTCDAELDKDDGVMMDPGLWETTDEATDDELDEENPEMMNFDTEFKGNIEKITSDANYTETTFKFTSEPVGMPQIPMTTENLIKEVPGTNTKNITSEAQGTSNLENEKTELLDFSCKLEEERTFDRTCDIIEKYHSN